MFAEIVLMAVTAQKPGSSLEGLNQAVEAIRAEQEHEAWLHPQVKWHANWNGIARCETGGNWSMVGASFSGGVGFANTTWNGFGGRQYASKAGYATKDQQIAIAERVYARYGLSGWGCRAYG